jgi:DNA-binding ferritin-like protein
METEKFLLRLEETLAHLTRQQEAICAELVAMRERVDAIDERTAAAPSRAPTRDELLEFLDRFRAGEALGEASTRAWIEVSDVACVKGGLRVVAEREGMHARLLADCIRAHGGTPRHELPEAVQEQALQRVSDRSRGDAAKVLEFVQTFGDTEKALAPIHAMAERLDDDPETQALLRTIAQDERATLEFFQQACRLLNS